MKKLLLIATAFSLLGGAPLAFATPEDDLRAFRAYFQKRFPNTPFADYQNGIYSIDKDRRDAWLEFKDFAPPFEDGVELGKELFEKYNIGKCFPNGGMGIRQDYPQFDPNDGQIHTLEGEVMACLKKNGVDTKKEGIKYKTGKLAAITAYMASTSNGKKIDIKVPNDPRALAHYERGKRHFYAKRGQLNFSCADCHIYNSGNMARANLLSPALGQVTHFPVWRKKWQKAAEGKGKGGPTAGFGTLHRRYGGCNKQVRAKPFKAQSDEYKALEYFHTYMSNGLEVNAPDLRQ